MTDQKSRYGEDHIRRSAGVFIAGKLISAISGIVTIILLARYLSISEFAVYSTLTGFIALFSALIGFGITHAILRFLPELYTQHQDKSMRQMVGIGLLSRTITLTLAVILVSFVSGPVTTFFNLSEWQEAFNLFLLLIWVRVTFHFLFQILETLLAQAVGQSGFVLTNILKLASVFAAVMWGELDLLLVIYIEIVTEIIGASVLLIGLIRIMIKHRAQDSSEHSWFTNNWSRVWRFGLIGYLQHLAVMLYGSSPNRLVGARYLASNDMASLGFAQSLIDTMSRYLPVHFFQGIIHPVLISRYAKEHDFSDIARISDLLLRFNTVILGLPLVILLVSGVDLLSFLSQGKYTDAACLALILFSVASVFESDRFLLDILVQAVERFDMLLYTNLLLSSSILLAFLLFPTLGIIAIPIANIAGLIVANSVVRIWLKLKGFKCQITWVSYLKIVIACFLSVEVGGFTLEILVNYEFDTLLWLKNWMITGVAAALSYLMMIFLLTPFSRKELSGLRLLKKGKG